MRLARTVSMLSGLTPQNFSSATRKPLCMRRNPLRSREGAGCSRAPTHMLKKKQMLAEDGAEGLTAAKQFYALAA
jgi:hypothetical protein